MKNKKGLVIMDVPYYVILFGIIAISIGVVATTLTQFRDQDSNTGSGSGFDSNTVTTIMVARYFSDLDEYGKLATSCTNVNVYNASAVNVTRSMAFSGTGNCYAVTNSSFNNTALTYNYTKAYTTYTYAYNISEQGLKAQDSLADWQGTWVVIFASAVILGIISTYLFLKG